MKTANFPPIGGPVVFKMPYVIFLIKVTNNYLKVNRY